MTMRYQQDLHVHLRDRLARLLKVDDDASAQIKFTVDWIKRQPALIAVLANAEHAEEGLRDSLDKWKESVAQGSPSAPETEAGRAWLTWMFLSDIAEAARSADENPLQGYFMGYYERGAGVTAALRTMMRRVATPLFDYLTDQVGKSTSMLYILERYVRRLEWFEQEELYAKYEAAPAQKGEEVYDKAFRRFLFDEGVNMPFSQARSPSGLTDVVVDAGEADAFVGEIKLFDLQNRGKRELAKGFNQAIEYAHDYRVAASYLVILNLTARALQVPTDGPEGQWPPYIDAGGVRVYLVVARALPRESASQQGKANPVIVNRGELLHPGADDSI